MNIKKNVLDDMLISERSREPAHYMLKIESFSLLSQVPHMTVDSDVFEASGHKWRLDLYSNGKKMDNKFISLYVVFCDTETLPKGCSVDVIFFLFMIMHVTRTQHFKMLMETEQGFMRRRKKWGFEKLISLESFKDTKNGKLLLYPKGNMTVSGTHISVYLGVHDASLLSDDWRVHADFTIRFSCLADDWGFTSFLELSEVTDAANGFLLNDTLIVEVEIPCSLDSFSVFVGDPIVALM
ncbi:uncharacterized protein [Rutidosis leptorrhynchoides]|uniref:uncharacterized protein n=1 Tax=Rutidosis leptorrhynchoides TaxID=125765 RepID=UPI003A990281